MSELALPQLSVAERSRLAELEQIVERGLETFIEVGQALMEIRDTRLYRETHPAFDGYCHDRWGFSRQRAHQLIEAAEVSTMVDVPNERQARELVPLLDEPETLRETWAEVRELHPEPTAADVREVVQQRTRGQLSNQSGGSNAWATPQEFFDLLDREFSFTLDVCASVDNAKCHAYFSETDDGLAQRWTGTCWMNPPYGDEIATWVRKAWESGNDGATVVCLVPARVDTGWWWDYCRHGDVRFLRGRLRFGDGENSAPFPSAVVVFPGQGQTLYWDRST